MEDLSETVTVYGGKGFEHFFMYTEYINWDKEAGAMLAMPIQIWTFKVVYWLSVKQ